MLTHPALAWEARYALTRIGTPDAYAAIGRQFDRLDPGELMRELEYAANVHALPVIERYLNSPDARVRRMMLDRLPEIFVPEAVALLPPLLADEDPSVRKSAREAALYVDRVLFWKSLTDLLPERVGASLFHVFRPTFFGAPLDRFLPLLRFVHGVGIVLSALLALALLLGRVRVVEPWRFDLFAAFLLLEGWVGDFLLLEFGRDPWLVIQLAAGCRLALLAGVLLQPREHLPNALAGRFERLLGASLWLLLPLLLVYTAPVLAAALRHAFHGAAWSLALLALFALVTVLVIEQWALRWSLLPRRAVSERRLSALIWIALSALLLIAMLAWSGHLRAQRAPRRRGLRARRRGAARVAAAGGAARPARQRADAATAAARAGRTLRRCRSRRTDRRAAAGGVVAVQAARGRLRAGDRRRGGAYGRLGRQGPRHAAGARGGAGRRGGGDTGDRAAGAGVDGGGAQRLRARRCLARRHRVAQHRLAAQARAAARAAARAGRAARVRRPGAAPWSRARGTGVAHRGRAAQRAGAARARMTAVRRLLLLALIVACGAAWSAQPRYTNDDAAQDVWLLENGLPETWTPALRRLLAPRRLERKAVASVLRRMDVLEGKDRVELGRALGTVTQDPRALAALAALAQDPDPAVARAASAALSRHAARMPSDPAAASRDAGGNARFSAREPDRQRSAQGPGERRSAQERDARRSATEQRRRAWLVAGALAGIVLGVTLFLLAFRLLMLKRFVRHLPPQKIRSAPAGLVAVQGTVEPHANRHTPHPYTGEICVVFDEIRHSFWVADDTGRILVEPQGAALLSEDGMLVPGERVLVVGTLRRSAPAGESAGAPRLARRDGSLTWFSRIVGWVVRVATGLFLGRNAARMMVLDARQCFWIWDDLDQRPFLAERETAGITAGLLFAGAWILVYVGAVLAPSAL